MRTSLEGAEVMQRIHSGGLRAAQVRNEGSLDLGGGAELSQDLVVGGCCGVEVEDQEREEFGSGCCCMLTGEEGWLGGIVWKVLLHKWKTPVKLRCQIGPEIQGKAWR